LLKLIFVINSNTKKRLNMKKIGIEMEKDIQLLKAMAKTGLMIEPMLPLLEISLTRIRQHRESGNIEKKGVYILYGSATNIYVLSAKAKKRMASEFLIDIYKSDTTQLEHDYVLLKIYLYLSTQEKESWLTESSLQGEYPTATKTTDGMFIANGKKIGVEVITDSYSEEDIKNKKNFIRYHCDGYIMLHTHKAIKYTLE
jgi:hypothetical protein